MTRGIKRGPPRRALMNFTRYCARIVSPGQQFTPIRPDHRGNFEPDRKLLRFPSVFPLPFEKYGEHDNHLPLSDAKRRLENRTRPAGLTYLIENRLSFL